MPKLLKAFAVFLLITAVAALAEASPRLRWKRNLINISISSSLLRESSNISAYTDVKAAIGRSLEAWRQSANVSFRERLSSEQNVSPAGNRGDGISLITIAQTPENLALFADGPNDASARTRVFFDRRGFISEADIVLNPYLQFSTDGTIGTFDLESTLTHEIGHLLGLPHSLVFGASMHENMGKNGIFNLPQLSSRTLSEDDISGVRALYGTNAGTSDCCGRVAGKLSDSNGRPAKGVLVWAEEKNNARVISEISTNESGNFHFDALPEGEYAIWAQSGGNASRRYTAEELGDITVERNVSTILNKKLSDRRIDFDLRLPGFNGQLAELAIPLNSGNTYTIYLEGSNLDPKKLNVGTNSWLISVAEDSLVSQDFGNNVSVLSFQVIVDPDTPIGEYSLYAENDEGDKSFLVGVLSIEKFPNL